jgi:hypothetical protein
MWFMALVSAVLWHSLPYFTLSDLRLPQIGRSGPLIYSPQVRGGQVTFTGTGFASCCLLRPTKESQKTTSPISSCIVA